MKYKFEVKYDSILKDYLFECGVSKRLGRKIKLYGKIYLNGVEAKNYYPVKENDVIEIFLSENLNDEIVESDEKVLIIYEDEHLLVVDKPYNLATQPSTKHYEDNLASRIKSYYLKNNLHNNIHIVTRLDYSTSGLVLVAKNPHIHNLLSKTEIIKKYYAKIEGRLTEKVGSIHLPIARDFTSNIKRKVDQNGKDAITLYNEVEFNNSESILELTLVTGRTHQIRVHLSALGYPIIGDKLYLGKPAERLYLHSYYISFIHPITYNQISLKSNNFW